MREQKLIAIGTRAICVLVKDRMDQPNYRSSQSCIPEAGHCLRRALIAAAARRHGWLSRQHASSWATVQAS